MNYKELLEHSFEVERASSACPTDTRLGFLSQHIFNFTTYDSAMDELFGRKGVEVCKAITAGTTFEYIRNQDNHVWFLLMCNTPFFAERIEWGTSIRGAWWAAPRGELIKLDSCGLWVNGYQITETLQFSVKEWERFMLALIQFAAES